MTMKLTQLKTYWNADEAEVVIEFLDELRAILLAVYADDIKAAKQERDCQTDNTHHQAIGNHDIF